MNKITCQTFTQPNFIVESAYCSWLFMGFVDNKENILSYLIILIVRFLKYDQLDCSILILVLCFCLKTSLAFPLHLNLIVLNMCNLCEPNDAFESYRISYIWWVPM